MDNLINFMLGLLLAQSWPMVEEVCGQQGMDRMNLRWLNEAERLGWEARDERGASIARIRHAALRARVRVWDSKMPTNAALRRIDAMYWTPVL